MKHPVETVGWPGDEQKSERGASRVQQLMAKGQLGDGDRARRRLSAALWLKHLYELDQATSSGRASKGASIGAQAGFSEAAAPPLAPSAARRDAFERAAAAMGPEFGVLYQTCCLDQKTRLSLLRRALDRLIDWLDPLRARQAR